MQEKLKKIFKNYIEITSSYKILVMLFVIYAVFWHPIFFVAPLFYIFLITIKIFPQFSLYSFLAVLLSILSIWAVVSYRYIRKEYITLKLSQKIIEEEKNKFIVRAISNNLKQVVKYALSAFMTMHILLIVIIFISKLYPLIPIFSFISFVWRDLCFPNGIY